MAKRLTETGKWRDPWFFKLGPIDKLIWTYLCDNCDHAGIWNVNQDIARLEIGIDQDIDHNRFGGRVVVLGPEKWFLPKFVQFQYGVLNPAIRAHKSVIDRLEKERVSKGLANPLMNSVNPLQGVTDKDKDKDKDIKGVVGGRCDPRLGVYTAPFLEFWTAYPPCPNRGSKSAAAEAWNSVQPSAGMLDVIIGAVANHKHLPDWKKDDGKWIPSAARWLSERRWEMEIPHQETPLDFPNQCRKCRIVHPPTAACPR